MGQEPWEPVCSVKTTVGRWGALDSAKAGPGAHGFSDVQWVTKTSLPRLAALAFSFIPFKLPHPDTAQPVTEYQTQRASIYLFHQSWSPTKWRQMPAHILFPVACDIYPPPALPAVWQPYWCAGRWMGLESFISDPPIAGLLPCLTSLLQYPWHLLGTHPETQPGLHLPSSNSSKLLSQEPLTWAPADQVFLPGRLSGNSHHSYCFLPSDLPAFFIVLQGLWGALLHIAPSLYKVFINAWGQVWNKPPVSWIAGNPSLSSEHSSSFSPHLRDQIMICKREQKFSSGQPGHGKSPLA